MCKTTATLLDNFFINFEHTLSSFVTSAISDHHAQTLKFKCGKENLKRKQDTLAPRRLFSGAKLEQYRLELLNETWENVTNENHVDSAYDNFINKINTVMNRVISKRRPKPQNSNTKSWLTQGIRKSSACKRMLYIQKLNNEVSEDYYKTYVKILGKVVRQAKRMHNTNYILRAENKSKATWGHILEK